MNYQRHYELLIEKYGSWKKPNGIYTERHRKFPGCFGGEYIIGNAFYVPARVHFLAHLLLVKIYPEQDSLVEAVNLMSGYRQYGAKVYSSLREKWKEIVSLRMTGEANPSKRSEVRAKNSASKILHFSNEENRKKHSEITLESYRNNPNRAENLKSKTSALRSETRAKMSAAKLGKKQPLELVEKRVAKLRGKKRTPEQLEAQKIRARNPETIAKIVAKTTGQKRSEETKQKLREKAILQHQRKSKETV